MLRKLEAIEGFTLDARDGDIGSVADFFFDDRSWAVRYVVADTGKWLPGRLVIISPASVGEADWRTHQLPVGLTKQQIEDSPGVERNRPVSAQRHAELREHYQWPAFWGMQEPPMLMPPGVTGPDVAAEGPPNHLRSAKEVRGYHVQAEDGEIGHVEDLIMDDAAWLIRYAVVDTRNWLPGRKVLVSTQWITGMVWAGAQVKVDLTCESIKASPEFDPSEPVNQEYEERLYDYYGRPKYWE